MVNDWAKILDKDDKGQVDSFILDFKKAFNIPHELLKSKLLGKESVVKHKWINAFLC